MRFMLNGAFTLQGNEYWRIDDIARMEREERDGTYDAITSLKRFDIAINKTTCTADEARIVVDALNEMATPPVAEESAAAR